MIRIRKPLAPPAVLVSRGKPGAQTHCDEFDASPAEYRSGKKQHRFLREVYAAEVVKAALILAQHGKCAFCESKVRHISYGDVEHDRPKAGYRQRPGDQLKRPGYYWLAYDWGNLFFCCQLCNQLFKKNQFPLKNGRKRARSHHHRVENEEPLLIQPDRVDPAIHITFREERAVPRHGSAEGKTTIRLLGLNRSALQEARLRRLQELKQLLSVRALLREKVVATLDTGSKAVLAAVEAALQASLSDASEYSGMARCLVSV